MQQALDTYVNFGRSQIDRLTPFARTKPDACEIFVEINGGPQAGSFAIVDTDKFQIGPAFDDDVFLVLDESDDRSVWVSVVPSVMGPLVSVGTERADVSVKGIKLVGQARFERLPCDIVVGDTSLRLSENILLEEEPNKRWTVVPIFGLIIIALLGLVVAFDSLTPKPIQIVRSEPIPAPEQVSGTAQLDVARGLIADAGLSDRLTLTAHNSTVTLTGNLNEAEGRAWATVRPDIDTALSQYTTFDRVRINQAPLALPAVSVVVLHPHAFVQLADRSRVEIGELLAPGATLTSIDASHFHLTRGGEVIAVEY